MAESSAAGEEYDYVVVGAGSSGCALAARLSDEGRRSVAVLEAGKAQWPRITAIPAALVHTIGNPKYDWQYVSEPDPTRLDRFEPWPRGLGPGGSGLINGMIFVRGAPGDYDAWRDLGASGWGYHDVLPYFRRFERSGIGEDQVRGQLGPQAVSPLRYIHPTTRLFIEAAVAAGIPFTSDYNGAEQDGVGYVQATQQNGRRHSPFDSFLRPAADKGWVRLIQEARARRILFEGTTAKGVEYERDGQTAIVRARKMVVLSGGSINSPQLLMLSGIGPAADLKRVGLTPLLDHPEVGANLIDHPGVWLRAEVDLDTLNQDATTFRKALALLRWLGGGGPATTATAQAVAFTRTRSGLSAPDVQVHFTAFGFTGPGETDPKERLIMVVPSVNHPESRGSISLKSADPLDAPRISPRLLEAEADMATLRRGVRLCAGILSTAPLAPHVRRLMEPPPLANDAELDDYIRASASPLYHAVGTCRMGSDDRAVVDPRLRVRGVQNLAVADASIMPRHISGNTHAAAMMIGERAAELLKD